MKSTLTPKAHKRNMTIARSQQKGLSNQLGLKNNQVSVQEKIKELKNNKNK